MLTVRLLHGRHAPDEVMTDWGSDAPLLGPLASVNMTYGEITLHPAADVAPTTLQMVNGLVVFDGQFYGDLEITCDRRRGRVMPREEQSVVDPTLTAKREELPSIRIPRETLRAYQTRVAVFLDSVRELAGEEAARDAERALMRVVVQPPAHPTR